MTSESFEARQWLKRHGLRPTGPRLAVLAFLKARGEHLTPAEIFEGLRAAGSAVSIATLYQNLQALSRRGLVRRIVGPDGAVRYDVNLAPHHHLVCQRCGRLVDVELSRPLAVEPVLVSPDHPVGDPELSGQAGKPEQRAGVGPPGPGGWRVLSAHVEFRGICPQCAGPGSGLPQEPGPGTA